MDDESLASWELVKHNEELMAKLSDGTATRTDQEKIESTMAAIEKRAEEKKALNTLTRKELMRKKDDLMWLVEKGTATRADAERLDNTLTAIEKRAEEKTALGTLTREELMRKNKDLMRLVGRGTATRADAERLEDTMDALKQEQKDRSSAKEETAALDREALMKRSAALMAVVGAGTATRCDKVHLEATMEAIEKAKADAEAVKTSMSMSDLIRRNEALMAKLKTGTATRAERERASDTTAEIERRTATNAKIAEESKTKELIMRNEALMKSLKEGTATKADREELEAIMKRKEALDAELKRTTAHETKAKLTKARAELRLTERKTAVRDVMRMVKASERVDLCFMVDATGSMGSQIEAVKTQITKIATDVQITNPSLKLRTAITGYRDALERDGGNSPFDFVDSLEAFVSNVSSINAQGGGDGCEDVASGLADVLGFSWSSPTRVLFFIADAPSHGARYHDGYNDNHTTGDHGIPAKLKQLQSMNIDVVFCRINPSTDKMVRVMNRDIGSVEDYIKTVTLNEPTKLTTHVTKSMRKSMHKTLTASRARTKLAGGSTSRLGGLAEVSEEKEELGRKSSTSRPSSLPARSSPCSFLPEPPLAASSRGVSGAAEVSAARSRWRPSPLPPATCDSHALARSLRAAPAVARPPHGSRASSRTSRPRTRRRTRSRGTSTRWKSTRSPPRLRPSSIGSTARPMAARCGTCCRRWQPLSQTRARGSTSPSPSSRAPSRVTPTTRATGRRRSSTPGSSASRCGLTRSPAASSWSPTCRASAPAQVTS